MKHGIFTKVFSFFLAVLFFALAFPLQAFAETVAAEATAPSGTVYVKSLKLVEGLSKEQAKQELQNAGYTFIDQNLNDGTGGGSVYIGYQTTTDPKEAIYDIKLMNMDGGFTRTSINKAIEAQALAMQGIASDLQSLGTAFAEAYAKNTVAAQKAFKALNLLRVVRETGAPIEGNGLGDRIANGDFGLSDYLEMILFCDATLVNSVVQILTMGILGGSQNWLLKLSLLGPYKADADYGDDEYLIDERASQLLTVLQLYAETYNALKSSNALTGTFNEAFELQNTKGLDTSNLTPEQRELLNLDISRSKLYKLAFEELEKYTYGDGTLESFFSELVNTTSATQLYPLVSILSDGEYSAMSFGCVLEMILGADISDEDFATYDEAFAQVAGETTSVYLYEGVNEILLKGDTVIAFTEEANRHIADTGEMEFYENETWAENAWETGKMATKAVAALAFGIFCLTKVTILATMAVTCTASVATLAASSGVVGTVVKACVAIGGVKGLIVAVLVMAVVYAISYIVSRIGEWWEDRIDWDDNPIPEYIYDVKEINIAQNGVPDASGAITYIQKADFVFYEVVRDLQNNPADLNAHSSDASQWLALYVSHDALDADAKPIKADQFFTIKNGVGELEGYTPLCEFGESLAKNLNSYNDEDDVNGIYVFFKQEKSAGVTNRGYYLSDIYLQTGESPEHCIGLLEAADYIPININLSPNGEVDGKKVYSYIGYKVTASEALALRDIRMSYTSNAPSYNYGGATYGEHGSSAGVTLYASKMTSTGTPIMADGLRILTDRADAEAGYEPVNFFSGGPAMSFNFYDNSVAALNGFSYYLYFLPQVQFTSGTSYLGGLTFFNGDAGYYAFSYLTGAVTPEHIKFLSEKTGIEFTSEDFSTSASTEAYTQAMSMLVRYYTYYDHILGNYDEKGFTDGFLYTTTFNPYRAIYDVSLTTMQEATNEVIYLQKGYSKIATIHYEERLFGTFLTSYEINGDDIKLTATVYVTGNSTGNVYDETKKKMTGDQPLEAWTSFGTESELAIGDMYDSNSGPVSIKNEGISDGKSFTINIPKKDYNHTYVSNIFVTDTASVFRELGGAEEGVTNDVITRAVALSSLGAMGATHFCAGETTIYGWVQGANTKVELKANTMYYGFSKSDKSAEGYTDFLLYYGGLNEGDNAPDKLYKGNIAYDLICELPLYNLTGVANSPAPRVYLYGTKNKKAGARIVDIAVSNSPFKEGYDTIYSYTGGSIWTDIIAALDEEEKNYPLYPEGDQINLWQDFFKMQQDKDHGAWNSGIYIHVRREGETKEEQKPYIGEVYIVQLKDNIKAARDLLFDMGADGMLESSLNETSGGYGTYLGYKLTADPTNAITDITAYHRGWWSSGHPQTLTHDNGSVYTLIADIDVNNGAGGFSDYIYLYATKNSKMGSPLIDIDLVINKTVNEKVYKTDADGGRTPIGDIRTMEMWNYDGFSDLNENGGGEYLYMTLTTRYDNPAGSYTPIDYGKDKTYSRGKVTGSAEGAYIAALYVMDKNTLRQEKLAAGVASDKCECADIPDSEVIDRLYAMGATEVLKTPILSIGEKYSGFDTANTNKIFIGYSRTDTLRKAIKGVMLYTDVLADGQPSESLHYGGNAYKLVAEGATAVTELPRAINLIGLEDEQDATGPKIYLYTTVSGTTPIYDITIDTNPFLKGYSTVLSQNGKTPFADLSDSAAVLRDEIIKDAKDPYSVINFSRYYLEGWYNLAYRLFNPANPLVSDWFLHVQTYKDTPIEEALPYIGEVFLAEGSTQKETLIRLLENNPDGIVDYNLNQGAGGKYIYLGYKRTADTTTYGATLTGLAILKSSTPAKAHFVDKGELSIRYDLVSFVNLNSGAGGDEMYLFSTTNSDAGNRLTRVGVSGSATTSDANTAMVYEIKDGTHGSAAVNVNAGTEKGEAAYLTTEREAAQEGSSGFLASLIGDGSIAVIVICLVAIAAAVVFGIFKVKKSNKTNNPNTEEDQE